MATKAVSGSATWMRVSGVPSALSSSCRRDGQGGGNDGCAGPASFQVADVAIAFDEGDVVGSGLVHRPGGVNDPVVAVKASLHQCRQLRNGDLHVSTPLSSLKGATPPPCEPE